MDCLWLNGLKAVMYIVPTIDNNIMHAKIVKACFSFFAIPFFTAHLNIAGTCAYPKTTLDLYTGSSNSTNDM